MPNDDLVGYILGERESFYLLEQTSVLVLVLGQLRQLRLPKACAHVEPPDTMRRDTVRGVNTTFDDYCFTTAWWGRVIVSHPVIGARRCVVDTVFHLALA